MSVINATPLLAAAGGDYQISRSVRLRSSASAYFNRTPASAGNRKTWTWSGWVKRGDLASTRVLFSSSTGTTDSTHLWVGFDGSSGKLLVQAWNGGYFHTSSVFRDPSAWYHVVVLLDTTQATAANRLRVFFNSVEQTGTQPIGYPSLNADLAINSTQAHGIGFSNYLSGSNYFDGYLTEINFIDGQALTPSSFGETDSITGVWKPKKYAGTYGTNGFYLNFSDNSSNTATTIGKDYSGNGNNWTPNNISVTSGVTYDSMIDVPTLYADGNSGRGNYAVVSPIDKASNIAVAQGNLSATNSGGASWASARGSIAVSSGKWYWEIDETYSSGGPLIIGIADAAFNPSTQRAGDTAGSYVLAIDGNKGNNGTFSAYAGGSIASGRNIGVALDLDVGTLVFYNNGVSLGTAYSSISGTFFPVVSVYGTQGGTANFNFGQRPFAYTPPTGFKALNTGNLPEPTIKKGNQYFDATTYTGNGSTQSIVNAGGFQPDLVWMKNRAIAANNTLMDTQRGLNALYSDLTNAENAPGNALTSFNANGFSLGNSTAVNGSGHAIVGWQWKESASAGFDIVTYTGTGSARTVAHNLGVAPSMMIVKNRTTAGEWWHVYHQSLGATKAVFLNSTNAAGTSSDWWNNTAPTSSVFTVNTSGAVNGNGASLVAYLFAPVAGFSAFGSYTGNGSADGPFVFCGFRPKFVLVKQSDAVRGWNIEDTSRNTYNAMNSVLAPQASAAEDTNAAWSVDALSNGFKIRTSDTGFNASGGTYIFAAFAESPFKTSLAR